MSVPGWPGPPPSCCVFRGAGAPGPSQSSCLLCWKMWVSFCSAPRAFLPASRLTVRSVLGGRFKKEIVVDGQSYLLLIRDEGGPPELQVRPLPRAGPSRVWGEGFGVRQRPGEAGNSARPPLVCCLGGRGGVCVQPGG